MSETQRIEDFIFVRELNEVFLLLDHISGRWDKSLYVDAVGATQDGPRIDELCAIGLAPAETEQGRVEQAVRLLRAKDKLNAAARPATGMTVAFTLLVVGEEDPLDRSGWWRKLARRGRAAASAAGLSDDGHRHSAPYYEKPTRQTLARYAFPGLVKVAARFNRRVFWIVVLLLAGLAFTCITSWHITGGNVILQHLDALKAQQIALVKTVADAELKFAADEQARRGKAGGPPVPAVQFCSLFDDAGLPFYRSTEEYQLCARRRQIDNQLAAVRGNLRDWLQPWKRAYARIADWVGSPAEHGNPDVRQRGNEELAQIVTLVVGTAVLPLCYGILGAGAAVVRGLWAKMRESLLSPRDYTLALLQLALGATIGACIALFINPSGQPPGAEVGLLGSWALSSSALSFVAGFGVEGVFLALESLVRRVFNVADPAKRPGG
jgi:hypothetical protein